jgi:hypothetical protein
MPPTVTIRPATESDLPALLSLLLTSFRQFPLFAFLYAPLDTDLSTAKDTIFFWRRRLLLELLDPGASIVVAELADAEGVVGRERGREGEEGERQMTDVERESWRMLDWIGAQGELSQESWATPGCAVVGFAIWNVRVGHAAGAGERERLAGPAVDFRTVLRGNVFSMRCWFLGIWCLGGFWGPLTDF